MIENGHEEDMKVGTMSEMMGLLRRGRAGGSTLRGSFELVVPERRVSACAFEGVKSDAVAKFCDSDNRRVVFLDEFPQA